MEKRFFGVPGIFPAGMVLCRNVSVLADYRVLKKSAYKGRQTLSTQRKSQFNCRRKLRKSQMIKVNLGEISFEGRLPDIATEICLANKQFKKLCIKKMGQEEGLRFF